MSSELRAFLEGVEKTLADEYQRILARATEDPGTAGDAGEENWAEFLRDWLPASYHVVTKGRIVTGSGTASPQVDVLVLKPSYPPSLRNKKLYLSGGVAAAFECKTTLTRSHVKKALQTASDLSDMTHGARDRTPYQALHSPIYYGLLAHSHRWAEQSAVSNVSRFMDESLQHIDQPRQMLDVVCVADLGTWWSARQSGPLSFLGEDFAPFLGAHVEGWYFRPPTVNPNITDEAQRSIPVAQLCMRVTERLAWEDPSMRSIADHFKQAGLQGAGQGSGREWELSRVYSPTVEAAIRGGAHVGPGNWDEWQGEYD